jgi:programmed cell death 6-interacting protein
VADENSILEFSTPFLSSLQALMLAQAQEGVWQRAVIGMYVASSGAVKLTRD